MPPFGIVSPRVSNINILQHINDNPDAKRLSLVRTSRGQWENQLTPFSVAGERRLWYQISSFLRYCARWYQPCERTRSFRQCVCTDDRSFAQGNILITGDGTALICDFEITRIITNPAVTGQCTVASCRIGVVRYMAPEQVNPRSLGLSSSEARKESDVYSFAMTAYEV